MPRMGFAALLTLFLIMPLVACAQNQADPAPQERGLAPYPATKMFFDYVCSDDCSGHRAGYEWSEQKGITNKSDCGGQSQSFREGCFAWVENSENGVRQIEVFQ